MDEIGLPYEFTSEIETLFNVSDEDGPYYDEIPEYIVEMSIQTYGPPTQVLFALFGNALTVLVMLRMKDRVHFMCSYLAIVAVTDTVVTLLISGNAWLRRLTGHDYIKEYMNQSDICCKFVTFLKHLCLHLTAWVTVTVIIENLVVSLKPLNVTHFKSQRVTDVMCLLLVLIMCLNLHYFWTYGLVDVDFAFNSIMTQKYCFFQTKTLKGESHVTDGYIWVSLDHTFVDYLPMAVLISSLVLTHMALAGRIGVAPREYRPSWDKGFLDAKAFITLTSKTLLVVGWAMPLTCVPSLVFFHLNAKYNSPDTAHRWALASAILHEWKQLFYSSKYFIYIITSPKVRQETLKVLSPMTRIIYNVCVYCATAWGHMRELSGGVRRVQQEDNTTVDQVEAFV